MILVFREMVSLIPRLFSFAVSGTPARTQVPDLIRVLRLDGLITTNDALIPPIQVLACSRCCRSGTYVGSSDEARIQETIR